MCDTIMEAVSQSINALFLRSPSAEASSFEAPEDRHSTQARRSDRRRTARRSEAQQEGKKAAL